MLSYLFMISCNTKTVKNYVISYTTTNQNYHELIDKYGCSRNGSVGNGCYTFMRYIEKDCVIAYSVNDIGLLMLLKGIRKTFTFISIKDRIQGHYLCFGGYNYKLTREDNLNFCSLKDVVVVDEDNFKKYKDKMLLKVL